MQAADQNAARQQLASIHGSPFPLLPPYSRPWIGMLQIGMLQIGMLQIGMLQIGMFMTSW